MSNAALKQCKHPQRICNHTCDMGDLVQSAWHCMLHKCSVNEIFPNTQFCNLLPTLSDELLYAWNMICMRGSWHSEDGVGLPTSDSLLLKDDNGLESVRQARDLHPISAPPITSSWMCQMSPHHQGTLTLGRVLSGWGSSRYYCTKWKK